MTQSLEIVRGTSKTISISVVDDGNNLYRLTDGESLRFAMKSKFTDTACEMEKVLTFSDYDDENDVYILELKPDDTDSLKIGRHYYDVGLQSGDDYIMIIECSPFDIIPNISSREEGE